MFGEFAIMAREALETLREIRDLLREIRDRAKERA